MPVQTKVVYSKDEPSPAAMAEIFKKVFQLGHKELGTWSRVEDPDTNEKTITRTWVDEETATEYLDFHKQFNPISMSMERVDP